MNKMTYCVAISQSLSLVTQSLPSGIMGKFASSKDFHHGNCFDFSGV